MNQNDRGSFGQGRSIIAATVAKTSSRKKDGLLFDVDAQLERKDEGWAESVKLVNLFGIIIIKTERV